MATSSYKISRKSLKQSDDFESLFEASGAFIADNLSRILLGAVALVALGVVIFSVSFYRQHQARLAADQFQSAISALDSKDYTKAANGFRAVADDYSGTTLGQLAQLYLASAYVAQNKPAQARDALRSYLDRSDAPPFHQLALMTLGAVSENLRDYHAAGDAYRQAAAIPGPQQGEAQIGAARVLALTADKRGAIAAYRLFLTQNPYSPDRGDVVEALARMGAAPQIVPLAPPSNKAPAKGAAAAPPASLKPPPAVAAKPAVPAASATH